MGLGSFAYFGWFGSPGRLEFGSVVKPLLAVQEAQPDCRCWLPHAPQEPPRVTGVKAFPHGGGLQAGEALLEGSFVWASKMEVKLLVKLLGERQAGSLRAALSHASRVKVRLPWTAGGSDVRQPAAGKGRSPGPYIPSLPHPHPQRPLTNATRHCFTTHNQVGVSNLVARGTIRVAIKPLLDELPVAGGVKVGCCSASCQMLWVGL